MELSRYQTFSLVFRSRLQTCLSIIGQSGVNFIQKKLSTNKRGKKYCPEELSKNFFTQINATLYQTYDATPLYIKEKKFLDNSSG